ncbi:MAG: hypothetical protein ACD_56C00077G0004 [uncultured bacterium]|nr:MAG: hypothetical protein ACD_56C00077G0004 [uncultured bacterium]
MNCMEYKYTGIILNKRDVGETDRIYTIYTLEGGKIRSLAKGVRKSHAKLASSLENITLADITIMRTRGLGKITGSIVEQNFSLLKRDCDALLEIFAGLSMFDKLIDFENPDPVVFSLLKNYLETVDAASLGNGNEKHVLLRLGFMVKLMDALGYSIEVAACVSCGKALSENLLSFSAQHGGALCANCAHENPTSALPIKSNAIKMMRIFLKNNISTFGKINATREDCDSVRMAMDDFLRWNT